MLSFRTCGFLQEARGGVTGGGERVSLCPAWRVGSAASHTAVWLGDRLLQQQRMLLCLPFSCLDFFSFWQSLAVWYSFCTCEFFLLLCSYRHFTRVLGEALPGLLARCNFKLEQDSCFDHLPPSPSCPSPLRGYSSSSFDFFIPWFCPASYIYFFF